MAAASWREIDKREDDYISAALGLLQRSLVGYNHLSVDALKDKMGPGLKPPRTLLHILRIYSFADISNLDNLNDPLVSAFFFLRRRPAGDPTRWAYFLTLGAKSAAIGGLNAADLKVAMTDVCKKMRLQAGTAKLEMMHMSPQPAFKAGHANMQQAFNDMTTAANPPKMASKGSITIDGPWTNDGSTQTLLWWNIVEQ